MDDLGFKLLGILGAVFLFGFAILVHELGHFLAAKFFGIGVNKFAIGFGPKIWAIVKGGTEYSLRWFPVGGFVALKGMVDDEEEGKKEGGSENKENSADTRLVPSPHIPSSPEPPASVKAASTEEAKKKGNITEDLDALRNRHPLVRMVVFTAGVTCNYLTAIVLVGFLMWYGTPRFQSPPNVLAEVPQESQFYQQGWRSGDRIVSIAGEPVKDWEDVYEILYGTDERKGLFSKKDLKAETKSSSTVRIGVQRDGTTISLPLSLSLIDKENDVFSPVIAPVIAAVEPNSPADKARLLKDNYVPGQPVRPMPSEAEMKKSPLRAGDRIVAINDEPVQSWQEMQKLLHANPNAAITVTLERKEDSVKRIMKLSTVLESTNDEKPKGRLGIISSGGMEEIEGDRDRKPFLEAFATAPVKTVQMTIMLVSVQVDFLKEATWQQTQRNLGGPIAIGVIAYRSAQQGLVEYLNLFIAISIILAVMNILPIPILDGGYIAITFIELIIRRPIPQRVLAPILTVFMFLFIILFVLIFYNDFRNWIFKH